MIRKFLLATCLIYLGVSAILPASATEAVAAAEATTASAESDSLLGEVIVTAQKRQESAQRVGIAITSLDANTLKNMNVTTAVDITAKVPSLQSSQVNQSVVNYAIRGVSQNDYGDQLEGPVALYIDDSYLAILGTGSQPIFDMAQVEVLRGPQGTLFGRNATGGLIKFDTNQPTKDPEGYLRVTSGNYGLSRIEVAGGGPITDNLQFRLAGDSYDEKGYVNNLASQTYNTQGGSALGAVHYRAVRGTLAWQPTSNLNVSFQGRYTQVFDGTGSPYLNVTATSGTHGIGIPVAPNQNPYGTGLGCGPAPLSCYNFSSPGSYAVYDNTSGGYTSTWYGGTLKVDLTVNDDLTLTSVTDAQHFSKDFSEDADGSPFNILDDHHTAQLNQLSQELRGVYTSGSLTTTGGLYYLQFRTREFTNYTLGVPVGESGGYQTYNNSDVDNQSAAAFAQTEYKIRPDVSLIGGVRYTHDHKEADYSLTDNAGGTPFVFTRETYPGLTTRNFDMLSAKAEVQWQVTNDLMLYASFNQGTKSGGFEFPGFLPVAVSTVTYGSERLRSYEVGEKLAFWDGRGRINTSVFYYDYKNYQAYFFVPIPNGFAQTIANRDAEVYGGESELALNPLPGLTTSLGISLLHSVVYDVQLPDGSVADRQLPQAPGFSGNALLRYEHSLWDSGLRLSEQFDVNYKGPCGLSVLAGPLEYSQAYAIGNAQLGLSSASKKWQASLFVKNMWNARYKLFAADINSLGVGAEAYGRPRSFGGSIQYSF